jgi:excinuclease ABC subunit B
MRLTIEETARRREKQLKYNADNNITPQAVASRTSVSPLPTKGDNDINIRQSAQTRQTGPTTPTEFSTLNSQLSTPSVAADPVVQYMNKSDIEKSIKNARRRMEEAAKRLDFIEAAQWRDEMLQLEELLK